MSEPNMTHLADRGAVSVTGADAAKFLQGLVTNDLNLLETQAAVYAGLLSPQGKILFDFFITRAPGGFLLETRRDMADALARRLAMYKLRASLEIKDVSADYTVAAVWGGDARLSNNPPSAIVYPDPRLPALGSRALIPLSAAEAGEKFTSTPADYETHRIGLGIPQGGLDFTYGDAFPHDALLDQLHGVAFDKGCYVGQEIVSRMEHRGTARKRIVPVVASAPLPSPGAEIKAGDVVIGVLGSTAGNRGLALIRLDRAADFIARGQRLMAAGAALDIEIPAWAIFTVASAGPGATP
jgi:folate-binding protein YgfZ